jgi:hypothetical protein
MARFYDKAWTGEIAEESRFINELRREALGQIVAEIRAAMAPRAEAPRASTGDASRKLLEIGPGRGEITARIGLPPDRIVSLDVSTEALRAVRTLTKPCQGDAARPPFRAASFRCVFINAVLMFLPLDTFAGAAARMLEPDGALVILEPISGNPFMKLYRKFKSRYHGYADWHSLERLEASLRRYFAEVSITPYYWFIPLALLPAPLRFLTKCERLLLSGFPRSAWMVAVVCRGPKVRNEAGSVATPRA